MLVTGAYYPEISSGGQQCRAVARVLRGRVRFLVLATAVDRTLPAESIVDDVRVLRVPIDVTAAGSRAAAAVRLAWMMTRTRRAFDLVHIHGISSKNVVVTKVARLLGKKIVLTLHTAGQDEPGAADRASAADASFAAADLVMSVSPLLTERYRRAGLPESQLRQTANGIDIERFRPAAGEEQAALKRDLGLPAGPVVLFVGFFSREKRPDALFDAWRRIAVATGDQSTLVLVGATTASYREIDPELAPRIRAEAAAIGLADRVKFVEFTNEIEKYYRAADVFVLPSIREALPTSLLEAMATGLPSIACRLPGATDAIIEDGRNGALVTPGNIDELREALAGVLTDRVRASALGEAARRTIEERYSVARVAGDWLAAYQHVLAQA
jgi:glycosyltransferase involved in cell wall biosynthesis